MKPSKLKRNLKTKYPQFHNKDKQYLKRHEISLKLKKINFHKFSTVSQKALVASLKVSYSYLLAKTKKP